MPTQPFAAHIRPMCMFLCRVACPALKAPESYCQFLLKQPSCIHHFSPTCMQMLDARNIVAVLVVSYLLQQQHHLCPLLMHGC